MADSILRLKVESQEYDNKLKQAAQGLTRYADECRKVGGTLEVVEKDTLDYVRAIGQMDTTSRTATGKLSEMKKAFVELSAQYKQMTDAEKNSPFGKALAASLDQLKGRIQDSKTQLDDINKELGNTKQSGDSAKGGIEGLTSALGINVKSLVGWGAAIGAAKGALDVAKDAFFASEQNLDDWSRTVYSAESVYQGFLTALNTGDISGFLNNINTIVKAASEAYNALDRLGTMKTIDTPQLTAKQSEIQRMQTMLRTGRWVDRADGVKSALGYKTGDVLPKEVLNTISQQLKSAMSEVAGIMKQEIGAANTAIDALYKEQAARLGMSNEQFKKGTASMAVFEENLQKAQKYLDFEREHTTSVTSTTSAGIAYTTNVRDNVANPYEQYKNWKVFKDDGELYQRIVQEIRNRGAAESQYYSQVGQAYRGINRVENVKVGGGSGGGSGNSPQEQAQKQVEAALLAYNQTVEMARLEMESGRKSEADMKETLLSAQKQLWTAYGKAHNTYADPKYKEAQDTAAAEIVKLGGEVKTATEAQKAAEQAAREQEAAAKKLAAEQEKLADTYAEAATAAADNNLKGFFAANKKAEGMGGTAVEMPLTFTATSSNIDAFIGHLKERLSTADVGSELFNKLTAQAADATAMKNVIEMAMKRGVEMSVIDPSGLWKKVFTDNPGDYIDDKTWEKLQQTINEKLSEMGIEPIKIDLQTGNLVQAGKDVQSVAGNFRDAGSAISAVGAALNSIEDPGVKVAGIVAQAIGTVASAFAGALASDGSTKSNIWAFIAAAAASTASMITMIDSIHSATGYANGGIIPGNSMSGDNMVGMTPDGSVYGLNAQEVVLNRAQVGNLASQLEGGVGRSTNSQSYVSGENIILGVNNALSSRGQGELVTTSMMERWGLI